MSEQALNRIADALFQQAKALNKQARMMEEGVAVNKAALELHAQQAATTAMLEKALANASGNRDS